MQSLSARKAQRAKQRAEQEKARNESPSQGADENAEVEDGEFDAAAWIADTVENITAQLGDLTDEQLTEVEDAEKAKKGRVGVLNAIAEDRKRREGGGAGWNQNAG